MTENGMFVVQMRQRSVSDEAVAIVSIRCEASRYENQNLQLTAVGVFAFVGHT
jgi:hypothetical protein